MSARDGGQAFPRTTHQSSVEGITVRQYFAIRCPFSLIFNSLNAPNEFSPEMLAKVAFEFADAMIKEGEK